MIRMTELQVEVTHRADAGRPVPCQDGTDRWLSEDPDQRAEAAELCPRCPVLDACRESADAHKEKFGVWAGVDRTAQGHGALVRTEAAA